MNNRQKIAYSGMLLLIIVSVIIFGKSYAFFTSKNEYHGRVNMVVGTLDYEIESTELDSNNSISLQPNEQAVIKIGITNSNSIDSKYGLTYSTNCENLDIGYINLESLPKGEIYQNETKMVIVKMKNNCSRTANVTFDIEGGFIYNKLVLEGNGINTQKEVDALDIGYQNDDYPECNNAQCMIDKLSSLLE